MNDASEQPVALDQPVSTGVAEPAVGGAGGLRLVGRGRSGAVYLDHDDRGRPVARKVFLGEGLSRLVLYVTTGAANPYSWNRHAVRAAVCRRKILRLLVRYWFDGRLRVPRSLGMRWNRHYQTYEMRARFVAGRHTPLRWFAGGHREDPLRDLAHGIMKPLKAHLMAAGFDGLLWQAGLGNPVAGGNFMLTRSRDGDPTWFWIDLESGVPALFPLNPLALIRFYLPRSFFHGRCLFDDVDVPKLREYLAAQQHGIERKLDMGAASALGKLVDKLDLNQRAWKALNRTERGTACYRVKGRISQREAQWYRQNPFRWRVRLMRDGTKHMSARLLSEGQRLARWCFSLRPARLAWKFARFVGSQRYRQQLARRYVSWRIRDWKKRGFLRRSQARRLQAELRRDDVGLCVTDFGVHIAIKPLVKLLQWCMVTTLYFSGAIDGPMVALLLASGGAIGRTAYTSFRCLQATIQGGRKPWLALAVGAVPVVGTAAFPVQLVFWSTNPKHRLPQFLLYDCCAGFGRGVPIWGGRDSLLECWSNRLPDLVLRRRKAPST